MREAATSVEMENDPSNPCIGCGPQNPIGLHLRFRREESGVSGTFVAGPHHQGWPGRLHSGVLYMALLEVANWAVFERHGRVGLPVRTSALATSRWVAIGETLRLGAHPSEPADGSVRIETEATDETGLPVAHLQREYELLSRRDFLRRMGYEAVPPELEDLLPPD